jgi:hypothetical protein
MDYYSQRQAIISSLRGVERKVARLLNDFPELREIKNKNALVRKYWEVYDDVSCESIVRYARKFCAMDCFDTEDNKRDRANFETAYRSVFTGY